MVLWLVSKNIAYATNLPRVISLSRRLLGFRIIGNRNAWHFAAQK